MKFWFITDTARVAKERAEVERLSKEASWFTVQRWHLYEGRFCVDGVIRAHESDFPIRLIYPDQFPQVPAWVEPQDAKAKWTIHQYGEGGALCLELRPDNWEESATGADVLTSAFRLLETENPLGDEGDRGRAPSAHNVGAVQSYDWSVDVLILASGCLERVLSDATPTLKAGYSSPLGPLFRFFVHDEVDRAEAQHPPTEGRAVTEIPVHVSAHEAPTSKSPGRDELLAAAKLPDEANEKLTAGVFALVLFTAGKTLIAFRFLGDLPPERLKIFTVPGDSGQRSGRTSEALKKHVAIIGVGSVGSKIAECLIRSGVHHLTLIDGDIMLPANLERHALDWAGVGHRKVSALKRSLLNIVPGAEIREVASNLNWQRSARTHASQVEAFAQCDVIVDATGDVPTAFFLGAVAAANARPFVSVEVFEGGIGALVASCVPGRDLAYATARGAFLSWCELQGSVPPSSAGRPYEALSDEGSTFVADDAAVTMAAAHGARVILDIVDGSPAPSEAAWLLVGFRKAWVFDGHGHTFRISVAAQPSTGNASSADEETISFIAKVLEGNVDQADSPE